MSEEELYKLALSDVPTYSLLNEILAIRDKRFSNEEVDYCVNVNGYISLDALNKYVKMVQENQQLKQWDKNKDTRNSRQRVANAKLLKENQQLKEDYNCAFQDAEELNQRLKEVIDERNNLLSVLDEIREYIDTKLMDINLTYGINNEFRREYDDMLEILDKVGKE